MPVWILILLIPLHDGSYLSDTKGYYDTKTDCLAARYEYITPGQDPLCVDVDQPVCVEIE